MFHNTVTHCPIAALPFIPHPQQRRVCGVHKVDDADIGFAGVFAVEPSGILLQGSFPRDRHCQHQGVERRMVESLADQFAGRQQNARRIRRQSVNFSDGRGPLLL